jgi:DMSO/TMAO reductase YedYZ molybdopterin-dependent catalytic subunit
MNAAAHGRNIQQAHPSRGSALFAALSGLIAAATGLSAGELLSTFGDSFSSPVIGVGNRAVDLAPRPVKEFAISTFGTRDKEALLIGMAVAIAVFAATMGLLARKRPKAAVMGLAGFGVLGFAAAVTGRTSSITSGLPSLLAAAVAIAALLIVGGSQRPHSTPLAGESTGLGVQPDALQDARQNARQNARQDDQQDDQQDAVWTRIESSLADRRRFLALGGFAAAAIALGTSARVLTNQAGAAARKAVRALPLPRKTLPPIPVAAWVVELATANPYITPNKDFYRIDTALVVPKVAVDSWTLTIAGMVDNPRTYTYEDILAMDLIEQDITLTCVSNEVGGILMGNARWLGIPLQTLLDDAGVNPAATQIMGTSVDGWSAGFPVAALKRSAALVAIGMNGEPLPFDHGYPARLVVPGIYGYASATKWLERIELTTLEKADGYWIPRGYSKQAPIKMGSRIDVPRGLSTVPAGRTAIAGVAWSQTVGIDRVEVRIDAGEWQKADLSEEVSIDTWRQWKLSWDAPTGQHEISVRCFDRNGRLQKEERVAPLPNGATGWHQIVVFVA